MRHDSAPSFNDEEQSIGTPHNGKQNLLLTFSICSCAVGTKPAPAHTPRRGEQRVLATHRVNTVHAFTSSMHTQHSQQRIHP